MASSVSSNLPVRFQSAFEEASRTTGIKFDYLVSTAMRESSMNASAKAPTSSATGLFQFVEQTWLETMKEAGPQLGYSNAASQITQVGDKYYVKDPQVRQQILDMRKDPKASALMAGAYTKRNEDELSASLDRKPTQGELYAAHFLGANGSSKLIMLAQSNPDLDASKVFPQQANANKNIFYDRQGTANSVSEVYDKLVSKIPNSTQTEGESKRTTLLQMFGLGDLFRSKSSQSESQLANTTQTTSSINQTNAAESTGSEFEAPSIVTESDASLQAFFSDPGRKALPSRYGLSYSPAETASDTRASRLVTSENGKLAIQEAQGGANRSRVYSEASTQSDDSGQSVPLPRRKPVTADIYVDSLGGALPRAKPNTTSMQTSAAPVDLVGEANERPSQQSRSGALDLTAFLSRNARTSINKS